MSEHRQLVRQLSITQRGAEKGPMSTSTERKIAMAPTLSEAELHTAWQTLQKDLAHKTEHLERILQRRKSGVRPALFQFMCTVEPVMKDHL